MKKTALVTLLLVLVLSMSFAGLGYIDEAYHASYKVKSGYEFVADAGAEIVTGFKTNSESYDMSFGLATDGTVTRNRLSQSSLGAKFVVTPSTEFVFDYDVFKADLAFSATGILDKTFVNKKGSEITKALSINADTDFDWMISVKNRRNYFSIGSESVFNYTKDQFENELSIALDEDITFGYYIPRDKADAVKASTHSLLDAKNDFDFVLTTDVMLGYKGNFSQSRILTQDAKVVADYYLPFTEKDNVMSFNLNLSETAEFVGRSSRSFNLKIGSGINYFLDIARGVNAHDHFSLDTGIDAVLSFSKAGSEIAASTLTNVHIPRLVPVELVDNFSLSIPADFSVGFALSKSTGSKLDNTLTYSATLYPFYWELRNGSMLLNMYINSMELKASYGESRGAGFALGGRDLNATATLALDPVQGNTTSASTICAAFDMDFYNHKKSVTISFGAEF